MKKVFVAALVSMSLLPALVMASDKCSTIPGDKERLACFDQKYGTTSIPASHNNWVSNTTSNDLDDTKTFSAINIATQGSGKYGKSIDLMLRCQSNTTEAYIVWNDYLGNDGDIYDHYKYVTYRIDKNPAKKARWTISTDNEATFVSKPIEFIRQLSNSSKLVVQTIPYNESPTNAVFDLSGIDKVAAQVAETCHWKL